MQPTRVTSITEYHRMLGLPKPQHPLISVIDLESYQPPFREGKLCFLFEFYSIALKKNFHLRMRYGQQACDFDEGVMFCMAPGQVLSIEQDPDMLHRPSGWMILIHPDFLWHTSLAKTIKQYDFFDYAVHEALHLSDKEETMLTGIVRYMEQEYHANIDKFSQSVIISQLELILTYTERFYQRQFITRKITGNELLTRFETLLHNRFNSIHLAEQGLPTVTQLAAELHVSPGYLSEMLKVLTGQNSQQHIHDKLIEKAKEQLSTTTLSVSEIAYELGFEHIQSFSKLFKAKTKLSPMAFRQSFN